MASLVVSVSTIGNGIATLVLTRIVRSSFSTSSGYTSTPSRFDNRSVPPSLQRVEAELDARRVQIAAENRRKTRKCQERKRVSIL